MTATAARADAVMQPRKYVKSRDGCVSMKGQAAVAVPELR